MWGGQQQLQHEEDWGWQQQQQQQENGTGYMGEEFMEEGLEGGLFPGPTPPGPPFQQNP